MAKRKTQPDHVETGGGAYVGGDVSVERGDFVGRDKVTVTQGSGPGAIARAFEQFYEAVAVHPDLPPEDRADLRAELEDVEQEIAKGEQADEGFLARRLRNIGRMAPDLLEVMLATFANPAAGLGLVAKKVAEKAQAGAQGESA
jgi:hypothetical protein